MGLETVTTQPRRRREVLSQGFAVGGLRHAAKKSEWKAAPAARSNIARPRSQWRLAGPVRDALRRPGAAVQPLAASGGLLQAAALAMRHGPGTASVRRRRAAAIGARGD